jgi:hypothetical protein
MAYTRSRWLEATEYLNPADASPIKQVSPQDSPNRFSMSAFYELPFGRGQMFFANANKAANMIIGGWQIEGTYVYQTGFPLRFGNDVFYLGGDPSIPKSEQTISRWFNTGAFVSGAGGTPTCEAAPAGNLNCATPADHLRTFPFFLNSVRIDPINNVDLGLRKDIHLREAMKIQLRVEFINAFNHPLFPGPAVNAAAATFGSILASNQLNYARRAQLAAKFIF